MLLWMKVNVEVVQRPVIFPSVTICHKNHLDSLVVSQLESMFYGTDYDYESGETTGGDDDQLEAFKRNYSDFSDKLTAFLKHYDNLSVMQYNYEHPEVCPVFILGM